MKASLEKVERDMADARRTAVCVYCEGKFSPRGLATHLSRNRYCSRLHAIAEGRLFVCPVCNGERSSEAAIEGHLQASLACRRILDRQVAAMEQEAGRDEAPGH